MTPVTCPDCGGDDVVCQTSHFQLFICKECGARFDEDDADSSFERSSLQRTRPRANEG